MSSKRLVALALVSALTIGHIPSGWAEETPPAQSGPDGGSVAAAAVSNIFYVPGKAIACAVSGVFWSAAMILTFGVCYKDCGNFVHGVCTGKWVLRGEDLAEPNE